ncbi:hypothetical protein [Mastigocoleus testarum]|uniref:hypothetical protein n=1 Tax=Mastigocoleus testarum TaxID=996925 RepID=UPI00137AA7A7|nr:hypothetical protein [Mastigocoleus testarum]
MATGDWGLGIALRAAASGIWRLGTGDWERVTHCNYQLQITNYPLPITHYQSP